MSNNEYDYRGGLKEVEREIPATSRFVLKIILWAMLIGAIVGTLGYGLGWFRETAKITQQEFGASALLKKYQWFKDASGQLDAKAANIQVLRGRQTAMTSSYSDTPRAKWDRTDKEQFNLWEQEIAGTTASYNDLAAEYNANMAKFNWAFANRGTLPQGADQVLPREYRTYKTD